MPVMCYRVVLFERLTYNSPIFSHEAAEICEQLKRAGQDLLSLWFSIRNKQTTYNFIGRTSR